MRIQSINAAVLAPIAIIGMCIGAGGASETRVVLDLKPNGSSVLRTDSTRTRSETERQIRMTEQYIERSEQGSGVEEGEDKSEPGRAGATADQKPLTDAELASKLRQQLGRIRERMGKDWGPALEIEALDVKSNSVRTVTVRRFAKLEEMVQDADELWEQSGFYFAGLRMEKDTNSNLKITMSPYQRPDRFAKQASRMLKASGLKFELRFMLPGKVLSSTLPRTEGNTTWIGFDASQNDSFAAAVKTFEAPVVVTAELGGLNVPGPLDSSKLRRRRSIDKVGTDLPITDAGPGFVAEAISVVITTRHHFPGGEKRMGAIGRVLSDHSNTGVVINLKLFPPKGRTLKSVTRARVIKAVDDQGRDLLLREEDDDSDHGLEIPSHGISSSWSSGREAGSVRVNLTLALPQPDAQSVEQIDAEALGLTVGGWSEMKLPKIAENATNRIDLDSVLPGAKLVLTKFSKKSGQLFLEGEFTGPSEIRQLEMEAKVGNGPESGSYMHERAFRRDGNAALRKFRLNGFNYAADAGGEGAGDAFTITVRFPRDAKRERVKFSLKGIDLF